MFKFKAIGISLLCVLALMCGISHAGVSGSKHDLGFGGSAAFQFTTSQVCVFCHTPHNTDINNVHLETYDTYGPHQRNQPVGQEGTLYLWNRALTQATSYLAYDSSTLNATLTEMRVHSLMCLGCHDGVGSLNVLNNYPSTPGIPAGGPIPCSPPGICDEATSDQIGDLSYFFGGGPNIGEDDPAAPTGTLHLENDHPVSFDYDVVQAVDGGLNPMTPDPVTGGNYVGNSAVKLFWSHTQNDYTSLECSSCHNPHDDGKDTGRYPFLVLDNGNSSLCRSCHNK